MAQFMTDDELKDQVIYWLTETGDFHRSVHAQQLEIHCRDVFPDVYAALLKKRRWNQVFQNELERANRGL